MSDGLSNQSFTSNPNYYSYRQFLEYTGLAIAHGEVWVVWPDCSINPANLDFYWDHLPLSSFVPNIYNVVGAGQSIKTALDNANAGDIVEVAGGATYNEQVRCRPNVTLRAQPGTGRPLLQGPAGLPAGSQVGVIASGFSSGWSLEGFDIAGFEIGVEAVGYEATVVNASVVIPEEPAAAFAISDCHVEGGTTGIWLKNSGGRISSTVCYGQSGTGILFEGQKLVSRADSCVVTNCAVVGSASGTPGIGLAVTAPNVGVNGDVRIRCSNCSFVNAATGIRWLVTNRTGGRIARNVIVGATAAGIDVSGSSYFPGTTVFNIAWCPNLPPGSGYTGWTGVPILNEERDSGFSGINRAGWEVTYQPDGVVFPENNDGLFGGENVGWVGDSRARIDNVHGVLRAGQAGGVPLVTRIEKARMPDGGRIRITGRWEVPLYAECEVYPGVVLAVQDHDSEVPGSRVSIDIKGRFRCFGSTTEHVQIVPVNSESPAGSWKGIRYTAEDHSADYMYMYKTDIIGAETGLSITGGMDFPPLKPATGTVYLRECAFSKLQQHGVYGSVATNSLSHVYLTMARCSVDVGGGSTGCDGVKLKNNIYAQIDSTAVTGDIGAAYGFYLDTYNPHVDASLRESKVRACSAANLIGGVGLFIASNSPYLCAFEGSSCKYAMKYGDSASPNYNVACSPFLAGRVRDSTVGVFCSGGSNPAINGLRIENCATGLYIDSTSTGAYSGLNIVGGAIGIKSWTITPHAVRNSHIVGFSTYGIQGHSASIIDLGREGDPGNNYICSAGAMKYVQMKSPRVAGLGNVQALYNWWGAASPPMNMFSSTVDVLPATTTGSGCVSPSASVVQPAASGPTALPSADVVPGRGPEVHFVVPEAGSKWRDVVVYDVVGRIVRMLASREFEIGEHSVGWDGRTDAGPVATSGLYFIRIRGGSTDQTYRVIHLRTTR